MSGETTITVVDPYTTARFWTKVKVGRPGVCWKWKGARNEHGYGVFRLADRSNIRAHRMAWWLMYGKPPAMNLLHTCDNPDCCNPGHTREGTQAENVADMIAKGRGRGARHSRLTPEQIAAIREAADATQREVAERFGVSPPYVSMIRGGDRLKEGANNGR